MWLLPSIALTIMHSMGLTLIRTISRPPSTPTSLGSAKKSSRGFQERTLSGHQGWARGVAHSVVVERIFTAYQNHQAVQFDDGPDNVALQNARDMIDLVARNNNLTR